MQQRDYRLGINGVKRMQAAYNTALVAQGAFSAYWTTDLRAVGGWPDAIGEDIVLTWAMLGSRGIVRYEPVALGFTVVPEQLGRLLSQRSRWARGMLEGLRARVASGFSATSAAAHAQTCWPCGALVRRTTSRVRD